MAFVNGSAHLVGAVGAVAQGSVRICHHYAFTMIIGVFALDVVGIAIARPDRDDDAALSEPRDLGSDRIGLLVLAVPRDRDVAAARWLALVGSVAGRRDDPLYTHFALGTPNAVVEAKEWIPASTSIIFSASTGSRAAGAPQQLYHRRSGRLVVIEKAAQYMAAFDHVGAPQWRVHRARRRCSTSSKRCDPDD